MFGQQINKLSFTVLVSSLKQKTTLSFFFFLIIFIFGCVGSSPLCEGFSPVAASGGHSSSRRAGPSPSRPLLLRSRGSRRAGSVVVVHGLSCSAACGIFLDQGPNPRSLHWQADSQPLCHQGSPHLVLMRAVDKHGTVWLTSFRDILLKPNRSLMS